MGPVAIWWTCLIGIFVLILVVGVVKAFNAEEKRKKLEAIAKKAYDEWRWKLDNRYGGRLTEIGLGIYKQEGERGFFKALGVNLSEVSNIVNTSFGAVGTVGEYPAVIGTGSSTASESDEWRVIATGSLYVTDRRIIFDGDKQNRIILLEDILSLSSTFLDISISASSQQKIMTFSGVNGKMLYDIITILLRERKERIRGMAL